MCAWRGWERFRSVAPADYVPSRVLPRGLIAAWRFMVTVLHLCPYCAIAAFVGLICFICLGQLLCTGCCIRSVFKQTDYTQSTHESSFVEPWCIQHLLVVFFCLA
jgi:hypothetical protein